MRKLFLIILGVALIMPISTLNSNAKLVQKKWFNCLKVTKYGIYSLGCDLAHQKPYYPLRGKNWVYSGDTFGFEYEHWWGYKDGYFDTKFQVKIIKGKSEIYPYYSFDPSGNYLRKKINIEKVHSIEHGWGVDYGQVKAVCKKGCIVQLLFSTKPSTSNKWKTDKVNIKVKKK